MLTCLSKYNLPTSRNVLARVLRALLTRDRSSVLTSPSPRDLAAATQLQFLASSGTAIAALQSGRLASLGAQLSDGQVKVSGRVPAAEMARLLGVPALPVIMPGELLALRLTEAAHREDHRRSVRDVTARVRRAAWIPGGNKLAKTVASRCMACKIKNRALSKQVMGDLPAEKLAAAAPFVYTALDFFGPWVAKGLAKGRRQMKVWGVMFSCLSTKAVCILAAPGYDTETFGVVYRKFCAIYGNPTKVFADHGPQIVAHAGADALNLGSVAAAAGRKGTTWVFSPKGCSWRAGQAEVCIRLARHTLAHQLKKTEPMDFNSLETLFLEVAGIINLRPIAVRLTSSDDFLSITPSDILLGRASRQRPDASTLAPLPEDLAIRRAWGHQVEVVEAWFQLWLSQAFPEMLPRATWKQEFRSVQVGDIGHIIYKSSLGKHAFRLCRIVSVSPDAHGRVRTAVVGFRPRHKADSSTKYTSKEPVTMEIGIQRFAVLLPKELQEDTAFSITPHKAEVGPPHPPPRQGSSVPWVLIHLVWQQHLLP